MSNEATVEDLKASRKAAIAAARDRETYEATEFGRRRVKRIAKWAALLGWITCLVTVPCVYVYRRIRRSAA